MERDDLRESRLLMEVVRGARPEMEMDSRETVPPRLEARRAASPPTLSKREPALVRVVVV